MNRTVYLPKDLDDYAKENKISLSALLQESLRELMMYSDPAAVAKREERRKRVIPRVQS